MNAWPHSLGHYFLIFLATLLLFHFYYHYYYCVLDGERERERETLCRTFQLVASAIKITFATIHGARKK